MVLSKPGANLIKIQVMYVEDSLLLPFRDILNLLLKLKNQFFKHAEVTEVFKLLNTSISLFSNFSGIFIIKEKENQSASYAVCTISVTSCLRFCSQWCLEISLQNSSFLSRVHFYS